MARMYYVEDIQRVFKCSYPAASARLRFIEAPKDGMNRYRWNKREFDRLVRVLRNKPEGQKRPWSPRRSRIFETLESA